MTGNRPNAKTPPIIAIEKGGKTMFASPHHPSLPVTAVESVLSKAKQYTSHGRGGSTPVSVIHPTSCPPPVPKRVDKSFECFDAEGKECQKEQQPVQSKALNSGNVTDRQETSPKALSVQGEEPTIAAKLVRLRQLTENIRQRRLGQLPEQAVATDARQSHSDRQLTRKTPVVDSRLLQTRNIAMNNRPRLPASRILDEVRNHAAFEQKIVGQIHDATMLLRMVEAGSQEESKLIEERTELTRTMQKAQNDIVINIQVLGRETIRKRGSTRKTSTMQHKEPHSTVDTDVKRDSRLVASKDIQKELDHSKKTMQRLLDDVKGVKERETRVQFSELTTDKIEARDDVNLSAVEDNREKTISPSHPGVASSQGNSCDSSRTILSPENPEGQCQPCTPASPEPTKSIMHVSPTDKAKAPQQGPQTSKDQSGEEPLRSTNSALEIKSRSDDQEPNAPAYNIDIARHSLESVPTDCDAVLSSVCEVSDGDFGPKEATPNGSSAKNKPTPRTLDNKSTETASRGWICEPATHVKYKNYRAAKYKAAMRASGRRPSNK